MTNIIVPPLLFSIMGARNWCAVTYDESNGELEFDLRIETEKGNGASGTKSYPVRAQPPRWQISKEHHRFLHTKEWEKIVGGGKK